MLIKIITFQSLKIVHNYYIPIIILISSHLPLSITVRELLSIASSLAVIKCCCVFGRPTVLQVKTVLSSGYNGDRVRLLVNVLPDSANGEMLTRLVVFDKGVSDLNQVTSIITAVSTSSLSVIVQVSVTEVVPAYSVPLGWTDTVTLGVGTVHNGMNNQDWIQNYVLVFILLAYSEESDHECCLF